MIEAKTASRSARMYYLVQCTSGDVRELMLWNRRGAIVKLISYLQSVMASHIALRAIKAEHGTALQSFPVPLTSCKNTLSDIGYLCKMKNPENVNRIVARLPYNLRQKWCEVADEITEADRWEVTIPDIPSFVEKKARVLTHPIFGSVCVESKGKGALETGRSTSRMASSFATDVYDPNNPNKIAANDATATRIKNPNLSCPLCSSSHGLSQCKDFREGRW